MYNKTKTNTELPQTMGRTFNNDLQYYRSKNVRFYLSYDINTTVHSLKSHFGVKTLGVCDLHKTLSKAQFHNVIIDIKAVGTKCNYSLPFIKK